MIDKNELLEIFKRRLEVTQETIEDEKKQGRYPSFLIGRADGIKDCIRVLEWDVWDKYENNKDK